MAVLSKKAGPLSQPQAGLNELTCVLAPRNPMYASYPVPTKITYVKNLLLDWLLITATDSAIGKYLLDLLSYQALQ